MNTYYFCKTDSLWCVKGEDYIPLSYKFKSSVDKLPTIITKILWEWCDGVDEWKDEYGEGHDNLFESKCKSEEELFNYLSSIDDIESYFRCCDFECGTICLVKDNNGIVQQLMDNNMGFNVTEFSI